MTSEELIEAYALYLLNEDVAGDSDKEIRWSNVAPKYKTRYRNRALAHFKQLNEWGVRMLAEDQYTQGEWNGQMLPYHLSSLGVDIARIQPLPEAKEER